MSEYHTQIMTAAHSIENLLGVKSNDVAQIGIILGSGLGDLSEQIEVTERIAYGALPGFPQSSAPGHAGDLIFGRYANKPVIIANGRLHPYEGWSASDVVRSVYLMALLGVKTLIVTNASGGLNPDYHPGDVMLINDHINLTGMNPLIGQNDDNVGSRFPDMSRAYSPKLRKKILQISQSISTDIHQGVYVGVRGPSLETSAERRYLRSIGADAVGMSTVLEVIAANHCGLEVVGLSAISNVATGGPNQQPDTIEDVWANAAIAGTKISELIGLLLAQL